MCGTAGVPLSLSADQTLQELIDYLVNVRVPADSVGIVYLMCVQDNQKFEAVRDPSLVLQHDDGGSTPMWMTGFLSAKTKPNLPKPLSDLFPSVLRIPHVVVLVLCRV